MEKNCLNLVSGRYKMLIIKYLNFALALMNLCPWAEKDLGCPLDVEPVLLHKAGKTW